MSFLTPPKAPTSVYVILGYLELLLVQKFSSSFLTLFFLTPN